MHSKESPKLPWEAPRIWPLPSQESETGMGSNAEHHCTGIYMAMTCSGGAVYSRGSSKNLGSWNCSTNHHIATANACQTGS
jgi:hypothetical protein